MKLICECNQLGCFKAVSVSLEVAQKIYAVTGQIIIVDGCTRGPEDTDMLVRKGRGYTVYQEKTILRKEITGALSS